jgi:ABC-type nickel/cobalt efflux system permease component RcnA
MSIKTWACTIGSILVCSLLAYSFYHLVAKRVLANTENSNESGVDTVHQAPEIDQTDSGAFRMIENINFPSEGYSVFSIMAFLVILAFSGFLIWYLYQRFLQWRQARDTPPDLVEVVPHHHEEAPPSYSRAERDADRERYVENQRRARPGPGRRHRRWRRANHLPEDDQDAPCPHHFHEEDEEMEDHQEHGEYIPLQRRHNHGSGASSPASLSSSQRQLPTARPRLSDTEVRALVSRYFPTFCANCQSQQSFA